MEDQKQTTWSCINDKNDGSWYLVVVVVEGKD